MKLNQLKTKGFTLVEILIVVIIVGLLAGIAVSKLGDSKELAVQSVKKSAAAELNKAIQSAYVKGNLLPDATVTAAAAATSADASGLTTLVTTLAGAPYNSFTLSSATEMNRNITDETPNGGYLTATATGTGGAIHRNLEVVFNSGSYDTTP